MSETQKLIKIKPEPYIKKQYEDGELIILPVEKGFIRFAHIEVTNKIKIDIVADEDKAEITVVKWNSDDDAQIFEYKISFEGSNSMVPWFVHDIYGYCKYLSQKSVQELITDMLRYLENNMQVNNDG